MNHLNKTYQAILSLTLTAVMLISCRTASKHSTENISILTVDGKEVPFAEGEAAVAEMLGDAYVNTREWKMPDTAAKEQALLCAAERGSLENNISYIVYDICSDRIFESNPYTVTFLNGLPLLCSAEELTAQWGKLLVTDHSFSDYTLFLADGKVFPPVNHNDSDNIYQATDNALNHALLNDEVRCALIVFLYENEKHDIEEYLFQVRTCEET